MGSRPPSQTSREHPLPLSDLVHDDDLVRRARRQGLIGEIRRGLSNTSESMDCLVLSPSIAPLFGTHGLQRGSTVLITGPHGQGATSLALSLCAGATRSALWIGMLNASRIGLLSASELGVALDHLVLIPQPIEKVATVASALMEACSLVLLGSDRPVARRDADRLQRRAREYRCVLLVLAPPLQARANVPAVTSRQTLWPEVPDTMIEIIGSTCVGINRGPGHLLQRQMRVEVTHRRGSIPLRTHELLLPIDVAQQHFNEELSSHTGTAMHQVG